MLTRYFYHFLKKFTSHSLDGYILKLLCGLLWVIDSLALGGGSDVVSFSCFGVRVSVMFHFMFVHYTFSSVWVAEWPPFGK